MPELMKVKRGVLTAAAVILALTPLVALRAQQPPATQPPPGQPSPTTPAAPAPTPLTPARVLVPVSASSFAAHPERFYGNLVTLTGPVDQILSPLAFSVDQDATKSTGQDVLILAPRLSEPVGANAYLTIIGEAVKFEPAEIAEKAKDLKVDLPADAVAKYRGKPAIIATTIVTPKYVQLTRKLPPPMTADEEMLNKVMKRVQPAFGAIRSDVEKTDMPAVKQNAEILRQAFTEVEAFWKKQGKADAIKWAGDARLGAENVERIVATGKWDDVKAAAATLGQSCQTCHAAYRERFDDGSFRIKVAGR